MIAFFAHFLFVLAAWTLTIKFLLPVAFALQENLPLSHYIMWDFWWVAHIALGWSLLNWGSRTYAFALAVAGVEIVIILTKFWIFLAAPQWSLWTMNWFVNKIFVLACFISMMIYLLRFSQRLRYLGAPAARGFR